MSLSHLKREVVLNLKNIPGPFSRRKLLVIECDDWGGIRTPSKRVYDNLVKRGLADKDCRYRKDSLATEGDLESLFETLSSVKDYYGQSLIMTPVCNVANPDFDKIRQAEFKEYYYQPFTETLKNYGRGEKVIQLMKEGIDNGIFIPELHGREHIAVQLWLQNLRKGNKDLIYAFDQGYVALELDKVENVAKGFRAEYYFNAQEQISFLEESITSSTLLFNEIFEFRPEIFVPSNAIFHPHFETKLAASSIKYLNVLHMSQIPDGSGGLKKKFYRNGSQSSQGLTYYMRNCSFEPTEPIYKGISTTLRQIQAAFRWGKPAIISTHRANFVGGIDPANREKGLKELQMLIREIIKEWPDIEFVSSREMFKILYPNRYH